MLSINSTFHEIENAHLRDNKNLKSIANEVKMGENKFRKLMLAIGYYHDTSVRKWYFNNDFEDLRHMSVKEFEKLSKSNTSNKSVTRVSQKVIKSNNNIISSPEQSNISNIFTDEEILILKEIAKNHPNTEMVYFDSILERLANLEVNKKERKTYLIDVDLIEKFDSFCKQNRVSMSDVMSIAIIDLLNKYS